MAAGNVSSRRATGEGAHHATSSWWRWWGKGNEVGGWRGTCWWRLLVLWLLLLLLLLLAIRTPASQSEQLLDAEGRTLRTLSLDLVQVLRSAGQHVESRG